MDNYCGATSYGKRDEYSGANQSKSYYLNKDRKEDFNMKKYIVEMAVGYCASLRVDALNEEDAITKAKEIVLDNPTDYYEGNAEIEQINYIVEVE